MTSLKLLPNNTLSSSQPVAQPQLMNALRSCSQNNKNVLHDIIEKDALTAHFQPIISMDGKSIYGYEALCRTVESNPFNDIEALFEFGHKSGLTLPLDMYCRENGISIASAQQIQKTSAYLFINICPTSLTHPDHSTGTTEFLCQQYQIDKDKIVLEITEQEAVQNYKLFSQAVEHYRRAGFKIAIDDFGAGYGGLKMLSVLEPDFIKIDRHFFKNTTKSKVNFNLIDAIFTACHRIGIDVIAEGIETQHDLDVCREIGIDLVQGYYLARPAANLLKFTPPQLNFEPEFKPHDRHFSEIICIGDIVTYVEPVSCHDKAKDVLQRFQSNSKLVCIPVVTDGRLVGMINRHRFMENSMVGRLGFGLDLNYYKTVSDVLEDSFLQVPYYTSVEEVAKKIHRRKSISIYDDICVTRSGRYIGTVLVSNVLNAVTENSIKYAKGANPLTGLPGNEFIQRQITKMLSHSVHFDVCYIDIDNFKPYNDRHGFEMGDEVIKAVGEIADDVIKNIKSSGNVSFAGHIGGDDFIVITRPKNSITVCEKIISQFETLLSKFHTKKECDKGYYISKGRDNNEQQFHLLSLSIGVVSTEVHPVTSSAEISSLASDLKKRAKQVLGSVIIRDRRTQETEGRNR